MKKLLLSAFALVMGIANVSAQETTVPYILTAVDDTTYAVTLTQEEIAAKFDAQWVTDAWEMGVAFPAGTVMYENSNLVIKAAVDKTPVYTKNGKITQIKEEFPSYTGYINAGSTLGQNNWADDVTIQDIADVKANNQGIVIVSPKVAGKLRFGAYAGDNSREIGIYKLATDAEKDNDYFGEMVAKNNFRNDGENGTVKNAPAYVEAEIEPGHEYALLAGGNKNLCLHQITFVPSATTPAVPYILSAVGDNTYYVTMSQEDMQANYPAEWQGEAVWNGGIGFPSGTVLYENDEFKATSVHNLCCFWGWNWIDQMKAEKTDLTGYLNLGSSLATNGWTAESITIQDIADIAAPTNKNHGLIIITPKKAGKLSYRVYAGSKTRSTGIYKLATDEEKDNDDFGSLVAYVNFRNDGENGTTDKAPADVEADITPGHDYAIIAGTPSNVSFAYMKYVTDGSSDGINDVKANAAKTVVAVYTIAGAQVNDLQNGVNIVKYSDGSSVKVIK